MTFNSARGACVAAAIEGAPEVQVADAEIQSGEAIGTIKFGALRLGKKAWSVAMAQKDSRSGRKCRQSEIATSKPIRILISQSSQQRAWSQPSWHHFIRTPSYIELSVLNVVHTRLIVLNVGCMSCYDRPELPGGTVVA